MGNSDTIDLGIIRPIFVRAELVEIRKDSGEEWATFRVPIALGDQSQVVMIADCREATVEAAKCALKIGAEYYNARGKAKQALEDARVSSLKEARATLNSGLADAAMKRSVVGGGKREKVSFALWPCDEDEADSVVALIHTQGPYHRDFAPGDCRPLRFSKKERGRLVVHHLHIVITKSLERIWQLLWPKPLLFCISLIDGVVVHTFREEEPEPGDHDAKPIVEPEPAPAPEPKDEPAPEPAAPTIKAPAVRRKVPKTENGKAKQVVECSNAGCGHRFKVSAQELKKMGSNPLCPKCSKASNGRKTQN